MLTYNRSNIVLSKGLLGKNLRSTTGVKLLAGLEESEERTLELALTGHRLQHPKEHRSVHIVATGMHDTLTLGAELHTVKLPNGECVDIGTQHHGTTMVTTASLNLCKNTRICNSTALDTLCGESVEDEALRGVLLERQFGMTMQMAAEIYAVHTTYYLRGL